jgi:poly(A) polymerase
MTPLGEASRAFATDVVRQLLAAGHIALWAGGCVRDLLMGRGAQDFDVATSATPEQVRTLFGKRRTLAVGESFGVIIVLPPTKAAEPVEVATFRTEGAYLDGRRPTEIAFSTPEEDANRRDFTINGMFYDPIERKVLDYVGGEADLQRKVLRAIGDPHERMSEDKLRMLRAVRFSATLEFELDPITLAAVQHMAPELRVVSAERIAQELRKVLAHRTRVRGFGLLVETGLLEVLFPEVFAQPAALAKAGLAAPSLAQRADGWIAHIAATLGHLPPAARFELATAALLHQVPCPIHEPRLAPEARGTVWEITRRLKLSSDELTAIAWLVGHLDCWNDAEQQTDAQLKRVLAHPLSQDLRDLIRAVRTAACLPLTPIQCVDDFASHHTAEQINPPELLTGRDLIDLGLSPGPRFKHLLDTVRDAQLNGEIGTREEALELIRTAGASQPM